MARVPPSSSGEVFIATEADPGPAPSPGSPSAEDTLAFARFIVGLQRDNTRLRARVDELLAANNREVERRRAAEARLAEIERGAAMRVAELRLPSPIVGEGRLGRQPERGEGERGPCAPSPGSPLRGESAPGSSPGQALSHEGRVEEEIARLADDGCPHIEGRA